MAVTAGVAASDETAPHRDLRDVVDAELLNVERQKRHHDREAGESGEPAAAAAKMLRWTCEALMRPLAIGYRRSAIGSFRAES